MRSSGFGLGKSKKPQEEAAKKQPPTNADLTQLLGMSQKMPDRTFHYNWHSPDQTKMYYLNVITHGKADQRKGWAVSAHDNAAVGAADWTLQADIEGRRQQLFNMQSSDSYMVQSVIDEILVDGQDANSAAAAPLDEQWAEKNLPPANSENTGGPPAYGGAAAASAPAYGGAAAAPSYGGAAGSGNAAPAYGGASSDPHAGASGSSYGGAGGSAYGGAAASGSYGGASAQSTGTAGGAGLPESGSLSVTPIRTLFQQFVSSGATGRLLIDQGTIESEVFFTNGEPVHAKSVHSIYRDRDMTGDSVVVDLLTWTAGNYKFQNGYPAATRTVHSSADDLLAGRVAAAPAASVAQAAPAQSSAPPKLPGSAAPPIPMAAKIKVDPDDFSNADDLIGETFVNLIEPSGMLKYGMFLMLARTEFARHEMSRTPFCVAAIGLEGQGVLSYESIGKIQECFESAGQALDTISAATGVRFFALFPHCSGTTAAATLKQFLSNLQNTQLGNGIHGSALRMSVGICEVPRDGADFETVMNRACKLRMAATPERRIVLNAG
jgi:Domain of unknown function (DUF4388)